MDAMYERCYKLQAISVLLCLDHNGWLATIMHSCKMRDGQ